MKKDTYNILLADDHDILLESIVALLENEEKLNIVAKLRNGRELVEEVRKSIPDLCIIDMDMPVMNGIEASEELLKVYPEIKILILTMHKGRSLIRRMIDIGVKGYLPKTCDKDEFIFAIHQILKGKTYFPTSINKRKTNTIASEQTELEKVVSLTNREKEIAKQLCNGLSNRQIADTLFISPKTVDNHRSNLMRKLEFHNVVELIRFCLRNGLAE